MSDGRSSSPLESAMVRLSDAMRFDAVAPSGTGLRERLHQRIRDLLPHLGPTAVEALAWRWGHLTFR